VTYQQLRPQRFDVLPPVIKNLIIINGLVLMAQKTAEMWGLEYEVWITNLFALHNVQSEFFKPHQLVTHLFMHGDFTHFFFNMFALWMFANMLENIWGSKRFLIFYFLCGLGAAALHLLTLSVEYHYLQKDVTAFLQHSTYNNFMNFFSEHPKFEQIFNQNNQRALLSAVLDGWRNHPTDANFIDEFRTLVQIYEYSSLNKPTVGASGAVFGALAAFGYLFPNTRIYIYFFFPIKAKWFVILYAAAELWMGIQNSGGNVAHFAHLGGALIGFLLVYYWNKKNRKTFY
jgi:membrane associated rhomboid family serine protease